MTEQLSERALRKREREEAKYQRQRRKDDRWSARMHRRFVLEKIRRSDVAQTIHLEAYRLRLELGLNPDVHSVEYKIAQAFQDLGDRFVGRY